MLPLAQPPRKTDGRFDDWMFKLWQRISRTGELAWSLIDKTGSSIGDLETRNASDVSTNTVNFLGGLSSADSSVQVALETLDKLEKLATSIASAATTDLSTTDGNYVHVTGSTTITSFGTHTAGHLFQLVFDAAPLITHNGSTLILPGATNIQTIAGDVMIVRSEGSGTTGSSGNIWRCISYSPYSAFNIRAFAAAQG